MGKIFDFFKKELRLNKEYYARDTKEPESPKVDNLFHPSNDCIYLVYEFGHLFKVYPVPNFAYQYYINIVQDASFIISEGVQYDLSCKEAILAIEIPGYDVHLKSEIDKAMGRASSLEFALLENGNKYWRQKNYGLAIACYGKATQLMAVSDEYWEEADFFLIVERLREIGREEHAKKWIEWIDRNIYANDIMGEIEEEIKKQETVQYEKCQEELSFSDKETIMVQRVTTDDMLQFTEMPYQLNCQIKKHIQAGSHAFAYMDLNEFNKDVAKKELKRLDELIIQARNYIPMLTSEYHIDVKKVAFYNYSPNYGYTRLICTPHTFTGKISKHPLSLFFMTRGDIRTYSANGELFYNANGILETATVNIWRSPANYRSAGTGWTFTFGTFDSEFILSRAETTLRPDEYGRATTVYRCNYIIEEENARELNKVIFEWLQKHLPDDCPKSISGFSRMRNANSKNYKELVKKAESIGFVFPESLDDVANLGL